MAMNPHHAAIVHALNLVKKGEIDHSPSDPAKMSTEPATALEYNSFAATDSEAKPDKPGHYKLPIVQNGKVNADAVQKALDFAKTGKHDDLAAAIGHVSDAIDAKKEEMSIDDDNNGDELLTIDPEEAEEMDADVIEGGSDSPEEEENEDPEEDPDDLVDDEDEDEEITDDTTPAQADESTGNPSDPDGTTPPQAKKKKKLSAGQLPHRVSLRSMDIAKGTKPTVERDGNGAIRNVSVMQAGPALGHGFVIDKQMLSQIADQMKNGVQMRYTHPDKKGEDGSIQPVDSLGTHVGKVTNVKVSPAGDEVRGDIEFGPHAKKVPGLGDVSGYLMDLADSDPSAFGLSTVFEPDDYEVDEMGNPVGRSKSTVACDLTGDPASNRNGLL